MGLEKLVSEYTVVLSVNTSMFSKMISTNDNYFQSLMLAANKLMRGFFSYIC